MSILKIIFEFTRYADSMHECVEHFQKGKSIYVLLQYVILVRCTKITENLYIVTKIANEEFVDFKPIVKDKPYYFKSVVDGSLLKNNQIKELMVTFEKPFILIIKYDLLPNDFMIIIFFFF